MKVNEISAAGREARRSLHPPAWMVSLHGGHSADYCAHAEGALEAMLDAACTAGYHVFGLAEHAPRLDNAFLFPEEIERGWDAAALEQVFADYAAKTRELQKAYDGRMTILRGFELEMVPLSEYADLTQRWRRDFDFDFVVGSVHYVDEILIDGFADQFERAMARAGSLEALCVQYYSELAEMVRKIGPEVVGHFDVIRKYAVPHGPVNTPAIQESAQVALEVIADTGAILDLNTSGYRKGQGMPYPAPWVMRRAVALGIPFCFGDDSHDVPHVGAGIREGRDYLLEFGVESITTLDRGDGEVFRRVIPLR